MLLVAGRDLSVYLYELRLEVETDGDDKYWPPVLSSVGIGSIVAGSPYVLKPKPLSTVTVNALHNLDEPATYSNLR